MAKKKKPEIIKRLPGFSRYKITSDGTVINMATSNVIQATIPTSDGLAFQLTDDKGVRKTVPKSFIRESWGTPALEVVKMRTGQKFNYEIAMQLRKKIKDMGDKVDWKALADEYEVNVSTIRAINEGKRFTKP